MNTTYLIRKPSGQIVPVAAENLVEAAKAVHEAEHGVWGAAWGPAFSRRYVSAGSKRVAVIDGTNDTWIYQEVSKAPPTVTVDTKLTPPPPVPPEPTGEVSGADSTPDLAAENAILKQELFRLRDLLQTRGVPSPSVPPTPDPTPAEPEIHSYKATDFASSIIIKGISEEDAMQRFAQERGWEVVQEGLVPGRPYILKTPDETYLSVAVEYFSFKK